MAPPRQAFILLQRLIDFFFFKPVMKNTADEGIGRIYTFMGIIAGILKGGKMYHRCVFLCTLLEVSLDLKDHHL